MTIDRVRSWAEVAALGGSAVVFGYGIYSKVERVPSLEKRITVAESKIDFVVGGVEVLTRRKYRPPQEIAP